MPVTEDTAWTVAGLGVSVRAGGSFERSLALPTASTRQDESHANLAADQGGLGRETLNG
jgi:hypothetical protein